MRPRLRLRPKLQDSFAGGYMQHCKTGKLVAGNTAHNNQPKIDWALDVSDLV
jgi:hypothetical protein